MIRVLALFCCLVMLSVTGPAVGIAQACGLKLNAKANRVPLRSAIPTQVHIFRNSQSKSLSRALEQAGHTVVVVENIRQLKNEHGRTVVLADAHNAAEVKKHFSEVLVVNTTESTQKTLHELELQLRSKNKI
ncbi:MAG: hypothetical protein IPJ88_10575 [Myxococcales bacterium]|nr:MAG: hypothetical protein IPJ88_10575 [Myxococcales bacterium]